MAYQGKSVQCSEGGTGFIFTAGEQGFYAPKGLANQPKRCALCRGAMVTAITATGPDRGIEFPT